MRDEIELIQAAAAGDEQAFGELVECKREMVVRTAYQVTGDLDDALDVAQGVFIKLWRGLDRFDALRRFDTWIYRITVNAAIDLIRARGPKGTLQPLPDDPGEIGLSANDPHADVALDLGRLQKAFHRLAAQLAPKQRAAFVLREIQGLETTEVARVLGVTESTVRNHLMQARRILRVGLEKDYPELVPVSARGQAGEEER